MAVPQTRRARPAVFEEHGSDTVTLPERRRQEIRRVILASYFGTTIEYYDFLLYTSAASLVFAQVFFSSVDPATGTILSFVTLLAGYLGRPIGGIVFGHFGDRLGRKRMLVITMAMIGFASTLIGLLPTYAQWGALAPILLVVLRIVQGIAVGGDWGGSATMCVESAESGKRGLTAAFVNMGAPSGAVLASFVSAVLLFLGFIIGLPVVQSAIYGPSAAFISEMFSTEYRYTGASIGYQIAATLGGGVSPLIAVSLAAAGSFAPVTVYIMATFVLGLLIIRLAQEGTRINLQHLALGVPKA